MAKKLTDKQEKFAQLVVKTGNQSEAYRLAYDVSDKGAEWIVVKASQLAAQDNISIRIQEIRNGLIERNKVDKDYIISKHKKMLAAWEQLMALGNEDDISKEDRQRFYMLREMVKGSDYRGCLAELAKLTGEYAPTRTENKNENKNFNINIEIKRNRKE
jgi:phage terminase small subunit